jgi:hypothetical protein
MRKKGGEKMKDKELVISVIKKLLDLGVEDFAVKRMSPYYKDLEVCIPVDVLSMKTIKELEAEVDRLKLCFDFYEGKMRIYQYEGEMAVDMEVK